MMENIAAMSAPLSEPGRRLIAPLPWAQAVEAMLAAESRDRILLFFARGVASYLSGVLGYAVSGAELVELFSFGEQGFRRSKAGLVVPSTVLDPLAFAIEQGVPYLGELADPSQWQALDTPLRVGGNGVAVVPATVKGRTTCVLIGPVAGAVDAEARYGVLKLADAAGLALGRTVLLAREDNSRVSLSGGVGDGGEVSGPALDGEASALPVELDLAFVDRVISHNVSVPPYPGVATELNRIIAAGDFGLRDLAAVIRADQGLSAALLRHANASLQGGNKVASIDQALGRVGARTLVGLALSTKLGGMAAAAGPLVELKHRHWREAVLSATVCERLAPLRGLEAGEAFICGLLHDFGRVIATACIEELLAGGAQGPGSEGGEGVGALPALPAGASAWPIERWVEVVERYHVELGRAVCERWSLPEAVQTVVIAHHRPVLSGEYQGLVELVCASDHIAEMLESTSLVDPSELQAVAGLSQREIELIVEILPELPELVGHFSSVAGWRGAALSSLIHRPEGAPGLELAGSCAVELPVVRRVDGGEHAYVARQLALEGIVLSGIEPLETNSLVQLSIDGGAAGSHLIWMRVCKVEPEATGYRLLLSPYASGSRSLGRWQLFCSEVCAAH